MAEFTYPNLNLVEVDDTAVLSHVKNEYSPEQVFDESELEHWAESNGFVREEE